MAHELPDDPFLWDEDRIVQELCTQSRSWPSSLATKLPDPAQLSSKLRDCGIDGESLLMYEDVSGASGLKDLLLNDLDIKKIPHRLSVMRIIRFLQANSPAYLAWKKEQAGEEEEFGEDARYFAHSDLHGPGLGTAPPPERTISGPTLVATPAPSIPDEHGEAATLGTPDNAMDLDDRKGPAVVSEDAQNRGAPEASPMTKSHHPETSGVLQEEPPRKKKRIAVTTVADAPVQAAFAGMPTEADVISLPFPRKASGGTELSPESFESQRGYLGDKAWEITKQTSLDNFEELDFEFQWVRNSHMPRGRQIQIHRATKKYLRQGSSAVDRPDDPEDELLPLYDPDEDIDSETFREIELEEEDRKTQQAKKRGLSEDEVRAVLTRIIGDIEAKWSENSKPRCDRRAYDLWNIARRGGFREHELKIAERTKEDLDKRLNALINEICEMEWRNKQDIERQAQSMDPTVRDICHARWLVDLLKNPVPPPQRSQLPKPKPRIKEQPVLFEEDEEIIESDFETNSFIDDDDEHEEKMRNNKSFLHDSNPLLEKEASPDGDAMEIDADEPEENESLLGDLDLGSRDIFEGPRASARSPRIESQDKGRSIPLDEPRAPVLSSPQPKAFLRSGLDKGPATPSHRRKGTAANPIELQSTPTASNASMDVDSYPEFDEPQRIGETSPEIWAARNDAHRLIISVLQLWDTSRRSPIFRMVADNLSDQIWDQLMVRILERTKTRDTQDEHIRDSIALNLAKLFDAFISCSASRLDKKQFKQKTLEKMSKRKDDFNSFCEFLISVAPHFESRSQESGFVSLQPQLTTDETALGPELASDDDTFGLHQGDSSSTDMPRGPARRKKVQRSLPVQDLAAATMRVSVMEQKKEFEQRRALLRRKLALSSVPGDKSRLIINESKESEDLALIYINDNIGCRIKDHQIEGVRFMWNQIVASFENRQGCLLAHTMGLGKTMQVVTLLVAIAEASSSPDPSVYSQIPEDIRQTKVLVMCPSGLVNNWIDEFLIWAPEHVLGELMKIDATMDTESRYEMVNRWNENGGVLVVGYNMFRELVKDSDEIKATLLDAPNIVVGDEAHVLKNPNSQLHQATANFRTLSRIAMTGSPLTNNVMDYYAMIDWVAPGYLADITEFRQRFATPIKEGLYSDSTTYEKRKALKCLTALKTTVAPKVHRMGISALVGELPKKKEFVITVPLTQIQRKAYEAYVHHLLAGSSAQGEMKSNAKIWSFVSILGTLLAHPYIFLKQLQTRKEERAKQGRQGRQNQEEDVEELPDDIRSALLAVVSEKNTGAYDASNKIVVLLQILDEAAKCGDKVLIFSQSIPTLDYLERVLTHKRRKYFRLDGKTAVAGRQKAVKDFNNDTSACIYLISTRAGGVGLNIFGANRVVIFDFKYTPAEEQQAIGRAYRMGQTKPVFVYWLMCSGTFESTIHNKSVFKMQLASRVVDKKNPVAWSSRLGDYFAMPTDPPREDLSKWRGIDRVLDALLSVADLDDTIRQITSTDTFEEEDDMKVYELTTEEKLEVDNLLIEQAQRRLQSKGQPDSVGQILPGTLGQASGLIVPPHMQSKRPSPPSLPNPSLSVATANNSAATSTSRVAFPGDVLLSGRPLAGPVSPIPGAPLQSVPNPHPPPAIPPLRQLVSRQHDSEGIVPSQLTPQSNASSNPSQTRVTTNPAAASPPSLQNGQSGPATHQQQSAATAGVDSTPTLRKSLLAGKSTSEYAAELHQKLTLIHVQMRAEKLSITFTPETAVAKIEQALDSLNLVGIPRKDQLQTLDRAVRECTRFGEAILAGYINPNSAASMTRKQTDDASDKLKRLNPEEFRRQMSGAVSGQSAQRTLPNTRDPYPSPTATSQPATNTNRNISHAKPNANRILSKAPKPRYSPLIKQERPKERPKERPNRLPNWAQEGIRKSRQSQTPQARPAQGGNRPGDSADSPQVIE